MTEEVAASTVARSEIKSINFTTPYVTQGFYEISAGDSSVQVRFVNNDIENNKRYIKEAFAKLLGTSAKNITVSFDERFLKNNPGHLGHSYNISFGGALANKNIADIAVTKNGVTSSDIIGGTQQQGQSVTGEVQRISGLIGQGDFTLSLTQGVKTYTTIPIALGASASAVTAALNRALLGIGSVSVTKEAGLGDYLVSFDGALMGQNLSNLVVRATAEKPNPSGTFVLKVGSVSTNAITWGEDAVALAKRIQTQLATQLGAGNVQVRVDSSHSVGQSTSFEITYQGAQAAKNLGALSLISTGLTGVTGQTLTVAQGQPAIDR